MVDRHAMSYALLGGLLLLALAAPPGVVAQDDGGPDERNAARTQAPAPPPMQATSLFDLSGLAPLGPGRVLAVHDAKDPDELDRPRLSLLTLSDSPLGVTWQALDLDWPEGLGPSSDLESASAIPGESSVILAESGDDGSPFQRLFFVEVDVADDGSGAAALTGVVEWPIPAYNVESVAVASVDDEHLLLYAERAQGDPTTTIRWARLDLGRRTIEPPAGEPFTSPLVTGPDDRPVSAMEIGPDGSIYVASAYDSGDDDGPFSSAIFLAGWIVAGADGPRLIIPPEPELLATIDGFKVESLALVDEPSGGTRLYIGTDDEDFGGVLRPLRLDR